MRRSIDDAAVSPVIATVVLIVIVLVVSASVFLLTNGLEENLDQPAPHLALTTEVAATNEQQWRLGFHKVLPARPVAQFLFILRTPANGTLVADPAAQPVSEQMDHYWQLGASAGTGRHADNGTVVGAAGLGGFHLRLSDRDGDGRLGGGDRVEIWYDGDGDQGHQAGRDDAWPGGTYTFEVKHVPTDAFVAYETHPF